MSKLTFVLVLVALIALTSARVNINPGPQNPDPVNVVDGNSQVHVVDGGDNVNVVDGPGGPQPRDGN